MLSVRHNRVAMVVSLLLAVCFVLVSCSEEDIASTSKKPNEIDSPGGTLSLVASTELADMEAVIDKAESDLDMQIDLQFVDGTIETSNLIGYGEFDGRVDGVWLTTDRYLLQNGQAGKIVDPTPTALSPVAFGIRPQKAAELGWDKKQPTWAEISQAAGAKEFTYGMTAPDRSNSGFSALVSVATALADTGAALQTSDIEAVAPEMQKFFSAQNLTSGSSGWLRDSYLDKADRIDAMINYESVLESMKRKDNIDLEVIVPSDGVVTADYKLATMAAPKDDQSAARVKAFKDWLLTEETQQQISTETFRRPVNSAVSPAPELAERNLIELPFPATTQVSNALVDSYTNKLRVPARTVFALDVSGSMEGDRLSALQDTLRGLEGRADNGITHFRDREEVSYLPFSTEAHEMVSTTIDNARQESYAPLQQVTDSLIASGETALYDAVAKANGYATERGDESISSVVLMSDGEVTSGLNLEAFRAEYKRLPEDKKKAPVFVILYGEADEGEMTELAELTGGKVFDARDGNLGQVFEEIRGYQ
ncbi:extracellular solute-binding protein [Corynebacterium sp. H78]|uniref:extracellular solute-binding protein n=1 Tax=Corynebacterium sp. H78 TaxID=3133417 RepID=UPI00309A07A4